MGSGCQYGAALLICQNAAHGQASCYALGKGAHIGKNTVVLKGKELAGSAHAGLNLVNQQQPVLLPAQLLQLLYIFLIQRKDTALALNQLHHDGADIVPRLGLQVLKIVGCSIAEALGEGEEIIVEHILAGSLQGSDGPAVEGLLQGNDSGSPLAVFIEAVLSGQLDHALIGFTAAVGKEDLVHTGAAAEDLRQLCRGLIIIEIGNVTELPCLIRHSADPAGICSTQTIDADAAGKVQVLLPFRRIEGSTLAVGNGHRETAIGIHNIVVSSFENLLGIHGLRLSFQHGSDACIGKKLN